MKHRMFRGMSAAAILHDAGHAHLFVKVSCAYKFKRKVCFLGKIPLIQLTGQQDTISVATALKVALDQACTLNRNVPDKPRKWKDNNCCPQPSLAQEVADKVSLIIADAAADCKSAGRLLTEKVGESVVPHALRADVAEVSNLFSNVLGLHENDTHANTRLTQRG